MVLLRRIEPGFLYTSARWLFILLSALTIVAGILMISMVFVLQQHPNSPGQAIVFLGLVTTVGGTMGVAMSTLHSCMARKGVLWCYTILTSIASFGTTVLALFIFWNKPKLGVEFKSSHFGVGMLNMFFSKVQWAFLFLFVIEVVGLFLCFILHCSSPLESYESLDETRRKRAFGLFKLRQHMGIASDQAIARQAKSLAIKMETTYGKWMHS